MEKLFGAAFTGLDWKLIGPESEFMSDLEEILQHEIFHPESEQRTRWWGPIDFDLNLPESTRYQDEQIHIHNPDDFRYILDPAIRSITNLLSNQVVKIRNQRVGALNYIILSGSFLKYPYVRDELSAWCLTRGIHQINYLQEG